MIQKSYKYRLYPNKNQRVLLNKHFGCNRYVYNWALNLKINKYKNEGINLNPFDICYKIKELKNQYPWLKEVDSQSLQASVKKLDKSFKNFFNGYGFPKFKSKDNKQSFQCPANIRKIDWDTKRLIIPKFNEGIKINLTRNFTGKIKTVTISKTKTGKYYTSILVEEPIEKPVKLQPNFNDSIGVDLGIKHFITLDNGDKIDNPKYYKNELKRLKCLQRRLSKKQKGSNNRKKAKLKVAKQHERIANKRLDFLHKASSKLISENQTICIEDLNVKNMVKNHKLAQSISDVSWSEFVRQLEYKANWYGVNILKCDQFDPTSKTCSCGNKNDDLTLNQRTWTCKYCSIKHDRDILAANNVKKFALNKYNTGMGCSGELVEKLTLVNSMKQEL